MVDHKWTALSTVANTPKMHWVHIQDLITQTTFRHRLQYSFSSVYVHVSWAALAAYSTEVLCKTGEMRSNNNRQNGLNTVWFPCGSLWPQYSQTPHKLCDFTSWVSRNLKNVVKRGKMAADNSIHDFWYILASSAKHEIVSFVGKSVSLSQPRCTSLSASVPEVRFYLPTFTSCLNKLFKLSSQYTLHLWLEIQYRWTDIGQCFVARGENPKTPLKIPQLCESLC